ncbi:winged helix-turn-helix domain-containing protein [Microvirga thermotolerans]|uniref:Winged helix-turn-helix domain-containing protein n=1 Tax=Microvirga thermotolerans TaxID=2651334 RepID=A0A5P9K2V5_9HYPH|nr:winged helix-turn-helix domain-containing protein [Microvirga thermotolerans]QFU17975.1 winged helix-turn-helix domain-containing protein [Microvirga thermotolerans]
MPRTRLSLAQARRIALAAQGFAEPRPAAPASRHVGRVLARSNLLQIDSVNVLVRAHYMPLFSRLGAYDRELLEKAAYHRRRRSAFEYWGHEASLIRLDLHPLFRWRMARAARGEGIYGGLARFGRERRAFVEEVRREIAARGPLAAGDLSMGGKGQGSWWGWSDGKRALEWLFWAGEVTTATRRSFERVYDLPERVIPAAVLDAPTPPEDEAQRELLRLSIRALGIASERCLRDYFRLDAADAKARIPELVEAGDLVPATVEGWNGPVYLDPQARLPRKVEARALVSPFDPIVWERTRTERLFDFRYRIEIYTPAEKREFGYYCLPFLLGERIVARLDLKADRAAGRLVVHSIHPEAGIRPEEIAAPLGAELRLMAEWLRLGDVAAPKDWARRLEL